MDKSDLTARISELEKEVSRLGDIESTFHALFHMSPIGIAYHRVITDESGTPVNYYFIDANDNYKELTGVDPRGKLVTDAFPGIEHDPFDWIGTFGRVALTGETVRFQQYLEPVDRWYDAVGYQSSPGHFVAAFIEITEAKRKEAELERYRGHLEELVAERTAELERARDAAEAANRAKSVFLANMSHELRTPLNAVLGYTEIVAARETNPENAHYLKAIEASGSALLTLINDVLDLSKIEAGRMEVDDQPVSLRGLVSELSAMFTGQALSKDLGFTTVVDDEVPPLIRSDPTRLRQILVNLVGNAIKFTMSGRVDVRCASESGSLLIAVRDTGKGIATDDRESIFDSFTQATGQRATDYGGTGLGLSITAGIVAALGGRIEVESEQGAGSTFNVWLPLVPCEDDPDEKMPTRYSGIDFSAVRFDGARVLVVDDVAYNRDLLAAYLTTQGADCEFAVDGRTATERAAETHPDLILMDLKMPGLDGIGAARKLKDDPRTQDIPVVIVTASALSADEEAIREVADGYLRKPVVRATLVPELMKHLPFRLPEPGTVASPWTLPSRAELRELRELALDGDLRRLSDRLADLREENPECTGFLGEVERLASAYLDEQLIGQLDRCLEE
ncbi:MAG: ATP-binding protein [Spirochaetota bacterium]